MIVLHDLPPDSALQGVQVHPRELVSNTGNFNDIGDSSALADLDLDQPLPVRQRKHDFDTEPFRHRRRAPGRT